MGNTINTTGDGIPQTVRVNTKKAYSVHIGRGLLAHCGNIVRGVFRGKKAAVISDSVVAPLYMEDVVKSLKAAGLDVVEYVFPAGEPSKNITVLSDILEFLAQNHLARDDIAIALGGGVTGDITGFAAAVYLRGISYVQLPTTLLAAVDSSVGGKTAVDLSCGKNLAGAFWQPSAVICDIACLDTLPADIYSDGASECIKYGILHDRTLFDIFASGGFRGRISEIIATCVGIKGEIVSLDEFEGGRRRLLNLGHTAGHAIEKCSEYSLSHGRAVAVGMVLISRAGEAMGITRAGSAKEIQAAVEKAGLPSSCSFNAAQLAKAALSDKKRAGSTITLVIPEKIGRCILHDVPLSDLEGIFALGLKG